MLLANKRLAAAVGLLGRRLGIGRFYFGGYLCCGKTNRCRGRKAMGETARGMVNSYTRARNFLPLRCCVFASAAAVAAKVKATASRRRLTVRRRRRIRADAWGYGEYCRHLKQSVGHSLLRLSYRNALWGGFLCALRHTMLRRGCCRLSLRAPTPSGCLA